ncbi:MAG: hypothetical protein WCA35_03380, partial [Kovacikia sp.]
VKSMLSGLEGKEPPFLCNVALSEGIKVKPDRNRDRLLQELVNRKVFGDLAEAKRFVDEVRKKQWE